MKGTKPIKRTFALILAAPAAAHVSVQPAAASVYAMSSGRLGAIVALAVGLMAVAVGVTLFELGLGCRMPGD
jgi:hypothetical protein